LASSVRGFTLELDTIPLSRGSIEWLRPKAIPFADWKAETPSSIDGSTLESKTFAIVQSETERRDGL
jgi:hypothetical protein